EQTYSTRPEKILFFTKNVTNPARKKRIFHGKGRNIHKYVHGLSMLVAKYGHGFDIGKPSKNSIRNGQVQQKHDQTGRHRHRQRQRQTRAERTKRTHHHSERHLAGRSEEHTSELQSREKLVCLLLLEK